MTGVAGVVGYEVGRRGWDVDSTATVLRGITEEFKLIERELKDAGAPPTTRQRVAEREDENAASAPAGVTAEGAGMRWLDLDIPPSSYTDTIAAALTPEFPYLYARVPVEDKRTVTGLRQAGKAAGTKIGRRVKVEAHLMKGADPWRWVSISIDDLSAEERMAVSGRAMQILGDAIFPDQP